MPSSSHFKFFLIIIFYIRLPGGYVDLSKEDVLHGGDDVHLTHLADVIAALIVQPIITRPHSHQSINHEESCGPIH